MSRRSSVVIAVPRGGRPDPARDRLWGYTRPKWERTGWPIFEGRPHADEFDGGEDEPYSRSEAINAAVAAATAAEPDWKTVVVIDADVVIDLASVRQGVLMATESKRMTLPYREYVSLTRRGTEGLLDGASHPGPVRFPPGVLMSHVSSVVIVPRALWDRVGGFDERFVGWGCEDRAFYEACRVLGGGVERIDGRVYHLWHPIGATTDSPLYRTNKMLEGRYKAAKTTDAMRAVLDGH